MGNASCRKISKSKLAQAELTKRVNRESSDCYSKENPDNAEQGTDSKLQQKSPLGESQNQPRSTSNDPSKFDGRDDAELDDVDVSEGRDVPISNCIGEYNFLSGKGIIKKPEKKKSEKFDSGKSTQMPIESNKSVAALNSTKNKKKKQLLTPSVSLSNSDSTNNNVTYTTEVNEILQMLKTCDKSKTTAWIGKLKDNLYCLKMALMTPISEFVDKYPNHRVEMSTYMHYSPTDELYGLFLVVKNKNLKLFNFLWDDCGDLWCQSHIIPLLKELISNGWCKGISKLFISERVQEIFFSLDFYEKKSLFEDLQKIAETLSKEGGENNKKVLKCMVKALVNQPYAIFTFLFLFPYVHETRTPIEEYDIKPENFVEDLYLLANDTNLVHDLAVAFDKAWEGSYYHKAVYHSIIIALLECPALPRNIPFKAIWKSIKQNNEEQFRNCCNDFSNEWAKIITLRPSAAAAEFKDPRDDPRVNKLKLHQWKPLHLMLYYERQQMIQDIIEFAGSSVRKAITLDNRKKQTKDDFMCLKICIHLKSKFSFHALWKQTNLWTVKHLYLVLKELKDPKLYNEAIHKIVLKSGTTKDILHYWDPEIVAEFEKHWRQLKALKQKKRKTSMGQ